MFQRAVLVVLALLIAGPTYNAFAQMPDDSFNEPAPDSFLVAFETTKGSFEVMAHRDWAPLAADRFYHLVRTGYYDGLVFYRVVKNFVVQFGIHNEQDVNRAWKTQVLEDEPVKRLNKRGALSFARGGARSRTVQLFINLKDNPQLDTMNYGGVTGFPVFAEVVSGMDVVDAFHSEYGEAPSYQQNAINMNGKAFLDKYFPGLDSIEKAYIMDMSGE